MSLTVSLKGCIIISRRTAIMVQIFVTVCVFVMALAFPAAAQTPDFKATAPTATSAEAEEPPDGPENETVEERLKRLKDWRDGRKARAKRLAEEQVPVVLDSEKQNDILADSIKVEVEDANKKATKKVSKYDTPAMRKERKDREDAEKEAREAAEAQTEFQQNTGLVCPNPDDKANVFIHPESGKRAVRRSHSTMEIRNLLGVPVDILLESGGEDPIAVERMCPGGRISLQKVLEVMLSGNMVQVSYTAFVPGVELVQPSSPVITIIPCRGVGIGGWCQNEFRGKWDIRSLSQGANPFGGFGGLSPQQQQQRAPQERLKVRPEP